MEACSLGSPIQFKCTSKYPSYLENQQYANVAYQKGCRISRRLVLETMGFTAMDIHVSPTVATPTPEKTDSDLMRTLKPPNGVAIQEDQSGFNYVPGSGKGPESWGYLRPEWGNCSKGDMQSPIDLMNKRVLIIPSLGELQTSYKPANATLKNRGHDIELEWTADAGSFQINGTDYTLKQVHWHSTSEHTIDGIRFALELHMVHQSSGNKTAVIGILYIIGSPDPFISELEPYIRSISNQQREKNVGILDPAQINLGGGEYYRYMGSLTTPPCTEGVIWTISKRIRTASSQQVQLLRMAVQDSAENNARPLQQLNNREVQLYSLKSHSPNGCDQDNKWYTLLRRYAI